MPHGVPQFSGAVGGFCNSGIGNVGDLPSYQETVRSGGAAAAAAAAAWYSNPEPRYPTSKKFWPQQFYAQRVISHRMDTKHNVAKK